MVTTSPRRSDVVLFYPGPSLVSQVAQWVRGRRRYCLRLAWSRRPREIISVLDAAAMVILEATEHPGAAMTALEQAVARMPLWAIAAYTERNHPGLEVFVRIRGVILLTGPMDEDKWAAFLRRAEAAGRQPDAAGALSGRAPARHVVDFPDHLASKADRRRPGAPEAETRRSPLNRG